MVIIIPNGVRCPCNVLPVKGICFVCVSGIILLTELTEYDKIIMLGYVADVLLNYQDFGCIKCWVY